MEAQNGAEGGGLPEGGRAASETDLDASQERVFLSLRMLELKDLLDSAAPPMGPAALAQSVVALLLAFVLARILVFVYRRTKRGFSFSPQFTTSLVLIAVTATFIMAVVGNSVARAFSLAGALSIVRFRNALKETEDIVAVFLAMSIGVACGAGFFALSIVAVCLISALWLLQSGALSKRSAPRLALVTVETSAGALESEVQATLAVHARQVLPMGVTASGASGEALRLVYRVELLPRVDGLTFVGALRRSYSTVELSWLDEE